MFDCRITSNPNLSSTLISGQSDGISSEKEGWLTKDAAKIICATKHKAMIVDKQSRHILLQFHVSFHSCFVQIDQSMHTHSPEPKKFRAFKLHIGLFYPFVCQKLLWPVYFFKLFILKRIHNLQCRCQTYFFASNQRFFWRFNMTMESISIR